MKSGIDPAGKVFESLSHGYEENQAKNEVGYAVNHVKGDSCHPPCKGSFDSGEKNVWDGAKGSEEQSEQGGEGAKHPDGILLS